MTLGTLQMRKTSAIGFDHIRCVEHQAFQMRLFSVCFTPYVFAVGASAAAFTPLAVQRLLRQSAINVLVRPICYASVGKIHVIFFYK
uniref:Uncharacterized protein n=1 Tax=Pararge aegeria TaxID=116150 RepID=S4PSV0_9NEOP